MIRILRIFLKPTGTSWFDYIVPEDMTVSNLEARFRSETMLVNESGIVRYESMMFAYTILADPAMMQAPKVVPMKPADPAMVQAPKVVPMKPADPSKPWLNPTPPDNPAA
jgi:hypothetical protein